MMHSPPTSRREPVPQLAELESRVGKSLLSLREIVDVDPLSPQHSGSLGHLVSQVKIRWRRYMDESTVLAARYVKIASLQEAQNCREERKEQRSEVKQFISLANGVLKSMDMESLSNIGTESIISEKVNERPEEPVSIKEPPVSTVVTSREPQESATYQPVQSVSFLNVPVSQFRNCMKLDAKSGNEQRPVRPKVSLLSTETKGLIGATALGYNSKPRTLYGAGHSDELTGYPHQQRSFGDIPVVSTAGYQPMFSTRQPPLSATNNTPYSTVGSVPFHQPMNEATLHLIKQELFKESNFPFDGDCHRFNSWVMLLENRMRGLRLDPLDTISILIANTSREPKKLVQDYLAAGAAFPAVTLRNIWEALNKQYGSPVKVSQSMQRKLQALPDVRPPNIKNKLQDLVHLCRLIETNMMTNPELELFNLSIGQKQVWSKLPDWLQKKWRAQGHRHSIESNGTLPRFNVLIDFMQYALDEISDPNFEQVVDARNVKATYTTNNFNINEDDSQEVMCLYHEKPGHSLIDCRSFTKLRNQEKQAFAAEKRLCYKCLGNHMARNCDSNPKCSKCKKDHITPMHNDKRVYHEKKSRLHYSEDSDNPDKRTLCSVTCGAPERAMSCSKTILCELHHQSNPRKTLKLYAIIDDMSDSSYISEKVVSKLGLSGREEKYLLSTMNSLRSEHQGLVIGGLWIRGKNKDKYHRLPDMFTSNFIPGSTYEVGTPSIVKSIPRLAHFANRFAELDRHAEPLILLGRDAGDLMKSVCYGDSAPFVCETPLGYALIGSPCNNPPFKNEVKTVLRTTHEHYVSKTLIPQRNLSGDRVFNEFEDDDELALSRDDEKFQSIVINSIHVNKGGKITISLPFKNDHQIMPDNRAAVYGRTHNTLMKLRTQPSRLEQCIKAMASSITAGHVEPVPREELESYESGRVWFIPIFPVTQAKKCKTRLVYDSSAIYKGVSLNSVLLQGPDQNNRLRGVLMRFRMGEVAFGGDIEAMFYNFNLPDEDKNFLRFFWFGSNKPDRKLIQYRGCVHLFGNKCSPALAQAGLHFATRHPLAALQPDAVRLIMNNIYVDDLLAASRRPQEAIVCLEAVREILRRYHIRLRKIVSNSPVVTNHFPESERAEARHEIGIGDQSIQRALGLAWRTEADLFFIKVDIPLKPFTRRGMLSVTSSIYDPLGMVGPIVLQGKILQRKALQRDAQSIAQEWDEPLPAEFAEDWRVWLKSLTSIEELSLNRSYIPAGFGKIAGCELHTFTDASESAVGAIVYLKLIDVDDRVHVSYVISTSRLCPKSCISMPRSELCAALIGSRLYYEVKNEIKLNFDKCVMYCDSKVVLAYLNNSETRFPNYVSHRVKAILKLTESHQWQYVNSHLNPADVACRPQTVRSLIGSVWLMGPNFLWEMGVSSFDHRPCLDLKEYLPEVPMERVNLKTNKGEGSLFCSLLERVGCLDKALNVVVRVVSFLNTLLREIKRPPLVPEVNREIALKLLVRSVQLYSYDFLLTSLKAKQQEKHSLTSFDPFVDGEGLLRVGGRLKDSFLSYGVRHPLILPPEHKLSVLVVRHHHAATKHQGRHLTLGAVRSAGFFIEKCSKLIKRLLNSCVLCRKLRARPVEQLMASLPPSRIEEISPFHNTGVDVFGPFTVSDSKTTRQSKGTKKMWGLLLTCMSSRAVHVEPLHGLDSSSMVNALRRFTAVRGSCKNIYSDRGTNFVGVKNQEDLALVSVQKEMSSKDCEWHFNPPHASHFGGAWERKIGALKRVLDGSLSQLKGRVLNKDELSTLLVEAASIVNNTPMWEVSSDPRDPLPISPAVLLTLKECPNVPPLESFSPSDVASYGTRRWRRVQYIADCFWQRWRLFYLSELQERSKWIRKNRNMRSGDVVLLRNKSEKRNDWPLALVKSVKLSTDGLVRSVTLETVAKGNNRRVFERPISEIILLIPNDQSESLT